MSNRRILRLSGADTRDFLQGLITNDVTKVDQGLVYAAMLTPQGKYLADFFVAAEGDDLLVDVDESLAASLAKRLTMYRLRAKVTIEETDLAVRRGTGPAPEGALADPRHPDLGWRMYGAQPGDDGSDWNAIRVAHCIPETGIELGPDSYILEAGFERLNGVDFRKGCYVGQEVTARMKHKTTLRKGLATVTVEGEAPIGTEIRRADKPVGTLFTQAGDQAIAYLRFDRAGADMCAQNARIDWQVKT
ncbi:folate-binding protein YgfZ [Phaeobacter sp. HS012]|uniref:CAF17-like 4Fe-4S cluster assembly/insertion protein YgfZ n=1 Tax=unclassified Phaeobacter TaxID=2621772 RepID=UPI001B38F5E7|nr:MULTISPECIES: folate-binding protein YgfZ [unclassified Phaeobacter]MBQ4808690.1 folate-binding protein YgfZ [Phaeobacter sp. HS012]MBQ4883657.1 folate-binding protein YgfZ [Phaeobacter sp. HS011]